jgi:hypothetical protein
MDGVRHWSPGTRAFLTARRAIRDILEKIFMMEDCNQ